MKPSELQLSLYVAEVQKPVWLSMSSFRLVKWWDVTLPLWLSEDKGCLLSKSDAPVQLNHLSLITAGRFVDSIFKSFVEGIPFALEVTVIRATRDLLLSMGSPQSSSANVSVVKEWHADERRQQCQELCEPHGHGWCDVTACHCDVGDLWYVCSGVA